MVKKKVLLLNPPAPNGELIIKDQYCSFTSKAGYYWIPIDLLVLSGDLNRDCELKVVDAIIEGINQAELVTICKSFAPDHIVILSSILTHEFDRAFIRNLRKEFFFKTTFIGDVFYFNYKEMMQFPEVDSIIYEYPCPELVGYIYEGSASHNIIYRTDEQIMAMPSRKEVEINYATPAHHLFKVEKYSVPFNQDQSCTSVLTNFGCKYTCNYCPADSVTFRERTISDIIQEIDYLKDKMINNIWIRDFTFGLNRKRTDEFLFNIKKRKMNWFCLTRAEILDEELIEKMSQAGCYLIMMGVDSSNEATMKRINRRQNTCELKSKIKTVDTSGMYAMVHMILGFPGDSVMDMIKTIHFIASTHASFISINFFSPRSGSKYFSSESIKSPNLKKLDSNYALNEDAFLTTLKLNFLKYYALIIFYFNPIRVYSIIRKIRSKTQFLMLAKTGFKMFIPVSK